MTAPPVLIGFNHSVYQRIVRIALHEKGVPFTVDETDPFSPAGASKLRAVHPFGRVPVFQHSGFTLYETSAICRYIDAGFDGPTLVPSDPRRAARMAQVISIWDSYGYGPMIRQIFARRVFDPWSDGEANEAEIADGLRAARPVLEALNALARVRTH